MINGMRYYVCSGDRLAPQCQEYQAPPSLERVVISEMGLGRVGGDKKACKP